MQVKALFQGSDVSVKEFRCNAGPADRPFAEHHGGYTLSYVQKGSFGCRARGKEYELVAGSLFVGSPGEEFTCTHDHHAGGDQCLSFAFSAELVDTLGGPANAWRVVALPPLAELVVLGERGRASRDGHFSASLDEVGTLLAQQFVESISGKATTPARSSGRDRQRAVEIALWIDENAPEPISLDAMSEWAGLSRFHFLRVFRSVFGLTPHQYLIRCRLRRAIQLMMDEDLSITAVAFEAGFGDLTNFFRTFRQAARVTPAKFQRTLKSS